MNCDCPRPAALPTIEAYDCAENIGQIQKMIFQRAGFQFDSGAVTPILFNAKADWETLLAAVDDTKVVVTPFMTEVTIPQNAPVTFGGNDNTTIDGITRVDGTESVTVTGMLTSVPAKVVKQVREILECEENIVVYFINEFGKIIGRDVSIAQDGSVIEGIPVGSQSGFVSDAGNQGKNTRDTAMVQFSFAPAWRDSLYIATPEAGFFPKKDIVPAP
jgi:hypothetical protein